MVPDAFDTKKLSVLLESMHNLPTLLHQPTDNFDKPIASGPVLKQLTDKFDQPSASVPLPEQMTADPREVRISYIPQESMSNIKPLSAHPIDSSTHPIQEALFKKPY